MVDHDDNKPKIEFAPMDGVQQYEGEVDEILMAIGYENALVTDDSVFAHFPLDCEALDQALRPMGIDRFVTLHTTLLDAAKLLRQRRNPQ